MHFSYQTRRIVPLTERRLPQECPGSLDDRISKGEDTDFPDFSIDFLSLKSIPNRKNQRLTDFLRNNGKCSGSFLRRLKRRMTFFASPVKKFPFHCLGIGNSGHKMAGDEMLSSLVQEKGFFGQALFFGVWTPGLEEASLFSERRA